MWPPKGTHAGVPLQKENVMVTQSIFQLGHALFAKTRRLLQSGKTEEDLEIGFEKFLEPILAMIDIKTRPRYERLGAKAKTIYRGRPDAVHGRDRLNLSPLKNGLKKA